MLRGVLQLVMMVAAAYFRLMVIVWTVALSAIVMTLSAANDAMARADKRRRQTVDKPWERER